MKQCYAFVTTSKRFDGLPYMGYIQCYTLKRGGGFKYQYTQSTGNCRKTLIAAKRDAERLANYISERRLMQ